MSKRILSGKYEVQELIAHARMGAVYKAWDHTLEIMVALKILHSHLSHDTEFLERFRGEARKTARLRWHENIVQTFSVEHDQGTEYLVMEYFPSSNLRDELKNKGKLQIHHAVNIIRQIALALTYTHSHDIFHRDIQPANILIDDTLKVKLTDFGIAKALDQASFTSTGQLIGTAQYMSPEQARNMTLDVRTDLYSLGVVFQELITGRNLWEEHTKLEIIGNLQSEHTIPTVAFPSDVPEGIQKVIVDLLRYHPTDRIQDADSLVVRLEELRSVWDPTDKGDSNKTLVTPQRVGPTVHEDDQTIVILPENFRQASTSAKGKEETESLPLGAHATQKDDHASITTKAKQNRLVAEKTKAISAPLLIQSRNRSLPRAMIAASLCLFIVGGIYLIWSPNDLSPPSNPQKSVVDSPDTKKMAEVEDQAHLDAEEKVERNRLAKEKAEQDRLAEENFALNNSLKQLQRSIEQRDLRTLDKLSKMSESRYRMLDRFFGTYSTIEASVRDVRRASDRATITLQITKLIRPNGEIVPPPKLLQKITVVAPKTEGRWGPFEW